MGITPWTQVTERRQTKQKHNTES